MDAHKLAYAAGFFDGEGSVRIDKQKARFRESRHGFHFPNGLEITNTHKEVLEWFKYHFGGTIYPKRKRPIRWRPAWVWYIGGESGRIFIESIRPWLQVKSQDADLFLEFCSTIHGHENGRRICRPVSRETFEKRCRIYEKFAAIKRRGPVPIGAASGVGS